MKTFQRVALAYETVEACKAETEDIMLQLQQPDADRDALSARAGVLRARVDRLGVEINGLLREYGLEP